MGSTSFASVFDRLYYSVTDKRDKGSKFERLAKRYLQLGPKYADAVTKMRCGGKSGAWDKTRVIYNGHITLEGIPEDAHRYMLGSRSAIDWILERYQVKTDKASGILNDPNDWSREHHQPRYITDLLKKIVTVSIKTYRILDRLPAIGV